MRCRSLFSHILPCTVALLFTSRASAQSLNGAQAASNELKDSVRDVSPMVIEADVPESAAAQNPVPPIKTDNLSQANALPLMTSPESVIPALAAGQQPTQPMTETQTNAAAPTLPASTQSATDLATAILPSTGLATTTNPAVPMVQTSEQTLTNQPAQLNGAADNSNSTQSNANANLTKFEAPSEDFNLWQSVSIVSACLLGIAGLGVVLVRAKNKGSFAIAKSEKQMQVISSLALSPKRQILLVRIRDQEFAVASTEQGISFLTNIGASLPRQERQIVAEAQEPKAKARPMPALEPQRRVAAPVELQPEEPNTTPASTNSKSQILLQALKKVKEKAPAQTAPLAQSNQAQVPAAARTQTEPALKQTRASFPKYLANAFEQESKRELKTNQPQDSDENVESVTNMIREKLREMKPLS